MIHDGFILISSEIRQSKHLFWKAMNLADMVLNVLLMQLLEMNI